MMSLTPRSARNSVTICCAAVTSVASRVAPVWRATLAARLNTVSKVAVGETYRGGLAASIRAARSACSAPPLRIATMARAMLDRRHDLAAGGGIGAKLVGDDAPGRTTLLLEKTRQQAPCRLGVASRLEDFIEDIAVLIDRPPQPTLAAADGDDDLVEMPDVAATRLLTLEATGIIQPEFQGQRRTVS